MVPGEHANDHPAVGRRVGLLQPLQVRIGEPALRTLLLEAFAGPEEPSAELRRRALDRSTCRILALVDPPAVLDRRPVAFATHAPNVAERCRPDKLPIWGPAMGAWRPFEGEWGLILGASSGFGAATARELGRRGMGVIGAHLDRKVTLPQAEAVAEDVRAAGSPAHFFNVNAADDEKRVQVCERARELAGGKPLRMLLHSLAFGTLKPFVSDVPGQQTTKAQLEMTLDVMAHSLVYWVQDLHAGGR